MSFDMSVFRYLLSAIAGSAMLLLPDDALAHASSQGFVLLLPTKLYIASGITTVAVTAILLGILPARTSLAIFNTLRLPAATANRMLPLATSLASLLLLLFLIWIGFTGTSDPLKNPLPLSIWTIWWSILLVVQGVLGDIWKWITPWTGIYRLLFGFGGRRRTLSLPEGIGSSIGIIALVMFGIFALADPAPDNPARLATLVSIYWVLGLVGMCLFGERPWLERCECFTMLFDLFARISPLRIASPESRLGLPGWQIAHGGKATVGIAIFALCALGTSSFDGLNETFWWLDLIGVNPLEFPGRSAVMLETTFGLLAAVAILLMLFCACTWAGLALVRATGPKSLSVPGFAETFCFMALSVLPIALGYHFAHFLPSVLVNIQYSWAALSDPLSTGADLLGLGEFYVTTGFFNSLYSVRMILLAQCAAVIGGHVVAILAAHAIAARLFDASKHAAISQIPVAAFMVLYTFLSLWLLAAPRGA